MGILDRCYDLATVRVVQRRMRYASWVARVKYVFIYLCDRILERIRLPRVR